MNKWSEINKLSREAADKSTAIEQLSKLNMELKDEQGILTLRQKGTPREPIGSFDSSAKTYLVRAVERAWPSIIEAACGDLTESLHGIQDQIQALLKEKAAEK
jgi:hypothetical protein